MVMVGGINIFGFAIFPTIIEAVAGLVLVPVLLLIALAGIVFTYIPLDGAVTVMVTVQELFAGMVRPLTVKTPVPLTAV